MKPIHLLACCLVVAACSSEGGSDPADLATEVGASADSVADLPDARKELLDLAAVPDEGGLPPDAETEDLPPLCPDPDPMGCLPLEYAGATVDPTEYSVPAVFHELVDETLAGAAAAEALFALTREEFPFYDFQPEESPFGRLDWEYAVRHGYFEIPGYLEVFRTELEGRKDSAPALLAFLSDKTDAYFEHGSVEVFLDRADELAAKPEALQHSLAALWAFAGEEYDPAVLPLDEVPEEAHADLARLFYALYAGLLLQEAAFAAATVEIPLSEELYEKAAVFRTFDDLAADDGLDAFGGKVDFRQLYRGAEVVHRGMTRFAESPASWDLEAKVKFPTPLGFVTLGGTGKEQYKATPPGHLLVLDLGGNDKYVGPLGATRPGVPLSVILDLGGDDVYENAGEPEPSFAAGHLGYAVLLDVMGDDTYLSNYNSLASACLGVAILDDLAGNDSYSSVNFSQAAALLGIALLRDGAGADDYYSFRASQSYASYRGASLLVDLAGNDTYVAEAEINIYPSAQNSKYNANMAQGAGQGYRNDAAGLPNTYSGGVALLADLEGDDIYSAGLFAQGVGYWFGVGFHLDFTGNDEYEGIWYNFGASAHFAGGVHGDWEGDDTYFCLQDQCLGEGRDYSIGFMLNGAGQDTYWGKADRNIGAGDLYGTGIFWDQEGEDSYRVDGKTGIGQVYCDTENENSITVGLFFDTGGSDDEYINELGDSANSSLWTQVGNWNDGQWLNVLAVGVDH